MDVIGAGFGRTGTASFKAALEHLGFGPCYHMFEVLSAPERMQDWQHAVDGSNVDWDRVFAGYRATVDWPGAAFWRRLVEHYPQAKVVLSVRDPHRWWESTYNTIYQFAARDTAPPEMPEADWQHFRKTLLPTIHEIIWDGTFGGRFEDEAHAIEVFERHNAEVQREVPADRLLVYEARDGWAPLCEFLGVDVPPEPYPHVNETGSLAATVQRVMSGEGMGLPRRRE
ncbi:MAG: sulfotransferase family protein [Pseudonocardiaceae bacterium]|nr:sulfotransferase family protein [Pseudonocardiaceae bacterium]